jgi:hypothetical protein
VGGERTNPPFDDCSEAVARFSSGHFADGTPRRRPKIRLSTTCKAGTKLKKLGMSGLFIWTELSISYQSCSPRID